jgi:hypothetical protein
MKHLILLPADCDVYNLPIIEETDEEVFIQNHHMFHLFKTNIEKHKYEKEIQFEYDENKALHWAIYNYLGYGEGKELRLPFDPFYWNLIKATVCEGIRKVKVILVWDLLYFRSESPENILNGIKRGFWEEIYITGFGPTLLLKGNQ